jgi:hypothetical protein
VIEVAATRACTLVAGKSGSGKTTFALRYLVNAELACRFCWDADGQIAQRLGLPNAHTVEECELGIGDGFVCFDPNRLFPGNHAKGFAWFIAWAYAWSGRIQGRKLILVDEAWRYCDPNKIPPSLAECIQTGRVRRLDMMFCTQRPTRLNGSITNEATEVVSFALQGPNELKIVGGLGVDVDAVAGLPRGSYLATNCDSGASMRGRVF